MSSARSTAIQDDAAADELIRSAARAVFRDAEMGTELVEQVEEWVLERRDLLRLGHASMLRGALALSAGELFAATKAFRQARHHYWATGAVVEACLAELGCTRVKVSRGEYAAARTEVLAIQARCQAVGLVDDLLLNRVNARINAQLGDAHAGLGEVGEALRHYDLADNICHVMGDTAGLAASNLSRGILYLDLGMSHRAVAELSRAHRQFTEAGWATHAVTVLPFLAHAQSRAGRVALAMELLDECRPQLAAVKGGEALHDLCRARLLLRTGMAADALATARVAEQAFRNLDVVELSALATLACAEALRALGKTDAATADYQVAERLFDACGAKLKVAWARLGQADIALEAGDAARVRKCCAKVLESDLDPAAPQPVVRARVLLAQVSEADDADRQLDLAYATAARTGIPELRLHVALAKYRRQRRAGNLDVAVAELRRSVEFGRRRLRTDGDVLGGEQADILAATIGELIEALLARGDRSSLAEAWRRVRALKVSAIRSVLSMHQSTASDETAPLAAQPRPMSDFYVTADGIRDSGALEQALPGIPQHPVIDYYVSGNDIVAFVVRDGQVDVRRLVGAADETRRMVSAWQQECLLLGAGPVERALDHSPALNGLYERLLVPLRELLADLDEDVEVFTHAHLHAVPFDSMLDAGGPWRADLGWHDPVPTQVPHLPTELTTALVVAVPDASAPSIRAEAEVIFTTLPSAQLLLGADATREGLRRYGPEADVIHLACHGVFRAQNPLLSALHLGDGWLSAHDILREDLGISGSVVVLSACSSGRSADQVPAPLGLTFACLAVGARGVVAALWPVDDVVTAAFMTSFYGSLAEGVTVQQSLGRARRQVARTHPHPYFWAAFRYFALPD